MPATIQIAQDKRETIAISKRSAESVLTAVNAEMPDMQSTINEAIAKINEDNPATGYDDSLGALLALTAPANWNALSDADKLETIRRVLRYILTAFQIIDNAFNELRQVQTQMRSAIAWLMNPFIREERRRDRAA